MTHVWTDVFSILFALASIFLIFIVLLQRGRGGGLAGAFGATGGQSAFGTKAGDIFTKITIGVAVVWVALAAITGAAMTRETRGRFQSQAINGPEVLPAEPAKGAPAGAGAPEKNAPGTNAPAENGGAAKDSKSPASAKSTPPSAVQPATPPASNAGQPAPGK